MTQNRVIIKLSLHYVTVQFIYVAKNYGIVRIIAYGIRMVSLFKDNRTIEMHKNDTILHQRKDIITSQR